MSGRTAHDGLIHEIANTFGLPVPLLEAQVLVESSGDASAFRFEPSYFTRYIKGNVHAKAAEYGPLAACSYGLLQVLLETAMEHGFTGRPEYLFDPHMGLTFGATVMMRLWRLGGGLDADYPSALAAYNGGTALLNIPRSAWPVPVQQYVSKVYAFVEA